jgi:hypothetical protein
MKKVLLGLIILMPVSLFAASISSDSFTINVKFNEHSNPGEFGFYIHSKCSSSFMGVPTKCTLKHRLSPGQVYHDAAPHKKGGKSGK